MSYYKDQRIAFNEIDTILYKAIKNHLEVDINSIILQITRKHPIGALTVKKRILMIIEEQGLEIHDNKIVMTNVL